MKLITNNPYRILGVFVNTPLKERTSNINRFKAFIRVGKSIESETDFSIVLGQSPIRTIITVDEASNDLNLPIERLKRAFFWFACTNQAEAIAFRHLSSGDINKAISIFEKFSSWSSLLNYHTLSLLQGDLKVAIQTFVKIIGSPKESLFGALNLETLKISDEEICILYYEELSKEYNPLEILKASDEGLVADHLFRRVVFQSLRDKFINELNNLIGYASSTVKDDAVCNLYASQNLKNQASPILNQLRDICGENASEYTIIADKLALQILQNAIHYYNQTSDSEAARIVMPLVAYAKHIAVGHFAKSRCNNNYKTIKSAYDELPPIEIKEDINTILAFLNNFGDDTKSALKSKELVINCAPFLGHIKEKCGLNHIAAVRISTQIVTKALNSIIKAINDALQNLSNASAHSKYIERIKAEKILNEAWDAMLCLDRLPLLEEAKEWYTENCAKLRELMTQAGISTMKFSSFSIKTEPEYFKSCNTKIDYINYLNTYPNARYKQIAQKRIDEFERQEKIEQEERSKLITEINSCTSLSELWALQDRCSDIETLSILDNKAWSLCKKRQDYEEYLLHLPEGNHKINAEKKSKILGNIILDFLKKYIGLTIFFSVLLLIMFLIVILFGSDAYQYVLYIIGFIGAIAALGGLSNLLMDNGHAGKSLVFLIIGGFIVLVCFVVSNSTDDKIEEDQEKKNQEYLEKKELEVYTQFINNPTEENFKKYINRYRKGKYVTEVSQRYINEIKPHGPIVLNNVLNVYPAIPNKNEVRVLISQMCDSLYAVADSINTYAGWEAYQNAVPSDEYRDSDIRKDKADTRWNTEASAWKTAQELNTIAAYSRYIELYPKGKHYAQADKILIDSEVADVFSSEHGTLPAMDKTSYSYGSTSTISVYNNTSYTLTLLYSGPESKRLTLSSNGRGSVKLKNGEYRVAASVSSSDVQKYAGTVYLQGGEYEGEYYIFTTPPIYNRY